MRLEQLLYHENLCGWNNYMYFTRGTRGIWIIGASRQACSVRVRSVRDLHVERCTLVF